MFLQFNPRSIVIASGNLAPKYLFISFYQSFSFGIKKNQATFTLPCTMIVHSCLSGYGAYEMHTQIVFSICGHASLPSTSKYCEPLHLALGQDN